MPIAEGLYAHYDNGQPNGITEHWTLTRIALGEHLDIVFQADYRLTATVVLDEYGCIQKFDYHISNDFQGTYQRIGNHLQVKRTLPGNTRLADTILLPDDTVLDLPFVCCKGYTIQRLSEQSNPIPVFAPLLRSGDRAGDLAKRHVKRLANVKITHNAQTYDATHYQYGHDYWTLSDYRVLRTQKEQYQIILLEHKT